MTEQLPRAYKNRGIEYLNITCKSNRRRNRKERRPDKGFSRRHQTNSPPPKKSRTMRKANFKMAASKTLKTPVILVNGKGKKFRKRRARREETKYRRPLGEIGSKFKSRRPSARRGDRKLRGDFRLKIQERFIFLHGIVMSSPARNAAPCARRTRYIALENHRIYIEKNGELRI